MGVYEENIRVFEHTRSMSQVKYSVETEAMQCGVKVYEDPYNLTVKPRKGKPSILFDKKSTIAAAVELSKAKKVGKIGVLNFADALVPGGLVEVGEVTQEESLCRCSNLYEGLILRRCMENYYRYNQSLRSQIYSDRLIYSKDVLIFKHDSTHTPVDRPFYVDMITCPSPSCPCDNDILIHRIIGILRAAGHNGVTDIVLGAWGCGAFGQDAVTMGRNFGVALKECNYFKTVTFAIIVAIKATDSGNFYDFQDGFRDEYPF